MEAYDVIVIGGGPAGLSAAVLLARARRSVVVCDHGRPRNASTAAVHGVLSREGISPAELVALGCDEVRHYGGIIRPAEACAAARVDAGFAVELDDASRIAGRKLLLATGVRDDVPALDGIGDLYGRSVHHCPYCDGWEWRDRALAVYGRGRRGRDLAHALLTWSGDVVLFTDGPSRISSVARAELVRRGVTIVDERITRLEGHGGMLARIHLDSGNAVERDALFLATGWRHDADFARALGCRFTRAGAIWTDRRQWTRVPGVYAAGDVAGDVQSVVVSSALGTRAGIAINTELQKEERASARRSSSARVTTSAEIAPPALEPSW